MNFFFALLPKQLPFFLCFYPMFKVQTGIGRVLLCFHNGCRVSNFLDCMDHVGYEFQNFQKIDLLIVKVIPPFTN